MTSRASAAVGATRAMRRMPLEAAWARTHSAPVRVLPQPAAGEDEPDEPVAAGGNLGGAGPGSPGPLQGFSPLPGPAWPALSSSSSASTAAIARSSSAFASSSLIRADSSVGSPGLECRTTERSTIHSATRVSFSASASPITATASPASRRSAPSASCRRQPGGAATGSGPVCGSISALRLACSARWAATRQRTEQ